MPPSKAEIPVPGITLAITAQGLYLLNLLILPGIPFLILCWLYWRQRTLAPALAVSHMKETIRASLWALSILLGINLIIISLGGYDSPYTWMVVGLYFICCHSLFVLFGMFGLSKAMAGKSFHFPLTVRFFNSKDKP